MLIKKDYFSSVKSLENIRRGWLGRWLSAERVWIDTLRPYKDHCVITVEALRGEGFEKKNDTKNPLTRKY